MQANNDSGQSQTELQKQEMFYKNSQFFLKMSVSNNIQKQHLNKISASYTTPCVNKIEDILKPETQNNQELSISQQILINQTIIPNYNQTQYSIKQNGIISCYAANTNQGLIRNYNEDRITIILNMKKPSINTEIDNWPKCSFFGIYDGHGGFSCADFLKENLHNYVINDSNFPNNINQAIQNGFQQAEKNFLIKAYKNEIVVDRSGSCAIVVFIVDDVCYVANVGDSRAIMSYNKGKQIYELSQDHKPLNQNEFKRIKENGGQIYQQFFLSQFNKQYGPYRVLPGRLSVTRAFGDVEAKLSKLGGNQNVIIAIPEIQQFKIDKNCDFIIIGSIFQIQNKIKLYYKKGDGVYDKLNNQDIINCVWNSQQTDYLSFKDYTKIAIDNLFKFTLGKNSIDNISVILIGFNNFAKLIQEKHDKQIQKVALEVKQNIDFSMYSKVVKMNSQQRFFTQM
ncbi:protein phosphatase 2c, putative [Ichthyophthirius multifiliis]|uniref:protein-serine/threonine phosphatase n=1 Tax=Ichthyophthirius multifiliis TaxID=5932 RepID=G0R499_ICHMU|nr:protein phosphatase 2c, putative [Ichthyophthirius multifiliis]EGR27710.1 protein phosphatase 2c, putative [Ichthyophthirius multifiliis]|eukprot:XP_004025162.1 protein phosphatase 2c, putative [Ichthyophthirius multifiliis]